MATVRRSDLATRAIVGVALVAALLVALAIGGWLLWLVTALAALIALSEWASLVGASSWRMPPAVALLAIALIAAAPFLWGPDRSSVALLAIVALGVTILLGNGRLGWGLCYIGLAVIALLFLRTQPQGFVLAMWAMAVVILTDTGAYFAGRHFGGPKLAPRWSPNKTWAGLIGGMAAAGIGSSSIALAGGLPAAFLWLGAPLAIVAQAGDLYESALKRKAGLKDSGSLLPGHGGLLDRIDGAIPVLSVVAALIAGGAL